MAEADLHGFIEEVTGESHLRVEEDLGDGFVRLRTSEAERRQAQQDIRCIEDAVLELLRNARDAGAHLIYIATGRTGDTRHVVMIDDGQGIPKSLWRAVFEPRVTSKLDSFHADQWGVHGRGMALFSIKCNTNDAAVVDSDLGKGTALRIVSDAQRLPERSDQSSLPRLVSEDSGRLVVRGPRNINRIAAEFTLNQKGRCLVFLGSDIEILATMVDQGGRVLGALERALAEGPEEFPLVLRPSLASDPDDLVEIAASLGLKLSSRSARRILDGEVEPLASFAVLLDEALARTDEPEAPQKRRRVKRLRGERLHIDDEDLAAFSASLQTAFRDLAEQYYLEAAVQPEIRVERERLVVSLPLIRGE